MSKFLLDSNVIINFLVGREETIKLLEEIKRIDDFPATSPLCIAEVQLGVKKGEEVKTDSFLDSLRIFDLNKTIANEAGKLIREYKSKGVTLSFIDTLIATTCIANNLILVTYDKKHYPFSELELWTYK
ncbi:MAG: PIN domain-containing protein [Actinobacteria bacterium]|nr:PIN domain-containing protein [Actinomycetota bacterium]